jgi:putative heme-binding domain-containing protein
VVLLGYFERVREFIRKPYVIGGYMYANGVRVADLPLLQRDGLLKHATYASTREILPGNRLAAGRDVFALACSRCHTTTGMNGVVGKLENLYGRDEWDRRTMSGFLSNMHQIRPFMPPFPGNADELDAMVEYLIDLRTNREPLPGAQWAGVRLPRPVDDAMRLEAIEATLADGPTPARQKAFASLAVIAGDTADALLGRWLARLQAGQAPPELQLDLLEAARKRPSLKSQLVRYEQSFPKGDPLARFRPTLAGGDAERGQTVFQLKACQSCHRVRGQGGTVGPELAGVGQRQTREYLLESIVYPSAKIAKGYETLVVTTTDGKIVTGVLQSEQAGKLTLVAADGKEIVLPLASVDEREPGPSMMPADFAARLSPGELRDLVEFLATLK